MIITFLQMQQLHFDHNCTLSICLFFYLCSDGKQAFASESSTGWRLQQGHTLSESMGKAAGYQERDPHNVFRRTKESRGGGGGFTCYFYPSGCPIFPLSGSAVLHA